MSDDFAKRLGAIDAEYAEKVAARQAFIAEWAKTIKDIIRPVLKLAKDQIRERTLTVDENDNGISLGLRPRSAPGSLKPSGEAGTRLAYHPKANDRVISVEVIIENVRHTAKAFKLEEVSSTLIETQVEDFLNEAFGLKRSSSRD